MPEVSVIVPVYNGADTVAAAVRSLLDQTFTNFEVVVIDDGSTDGTRDVLGQFDDDRMRIVEHATNLGLVPSLRDGIDAARAPLIARLDADDAAKPRRLEAQVETMRARPDIGLVAGARHKVGPDGQSLGTGRPPTAHAAIWLRLHFGNCLPHSTIMFRRETLDAVGGYRPEWYPVEDYDLWLRMADVAEVNALDEVLCEAHKRAEGISATNADRQSRMVQDRSALAIRELTGVAPDPDTLARILWGDDAGTCDDQRAGGVLVAQVRHAVIQRCRHRRISRRGIDTVAAALAARTVRDSAGRACWTSAAQFVGAPGVFARLSKALLAR